MLNLHIYLLLLVTSKCLIHIANKSICAGRIICKVLSDHFLHSSWEKPTALAPNEALCILSKVLWIRVPTTTTRRHNDNFGLAFMLFNLFSPLFRAISINNDKQITVRVCFCCFPLFCNGIKPQVLIKFISIIICGGDGQISPFVSWATAIQNKQVDIRFGEKFSYFLVKIIH